MNPAAPPLHARSERQHATLLLLAGFCFGRAQIAILRELGSLLYGEEVVLWLVSSVALAGAALGYQLGGRLSQRALRLLLLGSAALHLLSPGWIRLLFAGLCALRGGTGPELLPATLLAAASASLPFCALLPAVLRGREDTGSLRALRTAYGAELVGFALGSALGLSLGAWPRLVFLLHSLAWLGILNLAIAPAHRFGRRLWLPLVLLATALYAPLSRYSLEQVYVYKHRIGGAQVPWSVDSTYQRLEVVQAPGRGTMLYLDGLRDLDTRDLATLNHYLARVPARLLAPEEALLLGNGTLSMVPELAALSGSLTTVEIDPAVVDAGARFFTPAEPLTRLRNWRLVIEDGKSYLTTTEHRFDLIIIDLPSPLTLGEAYLHTEEFYRLCRQRLRPGGVLAVQLSGSLGSPERTPARVVAGLQAAFSELLIVESELAERSFAYASDALPFTPSEVRASAAAGEKKLRTIPGADLDERTRRAAPMRLDDLDIVLRRGLERFLKRHRTSRAA